MSLKITTKLNIETQTKSISNQQIEVAPWVQKALFPQDENSEQETSHFVQMQLPAHTIHQTLQMKKMRDF